ncbi:alpha/beta hydrolase [Pseudomaricurvus alkylphenolicus]|uniref:alpha/beta fold hydrolase n=1 Tax=Pseudomaricurvus alkylphenolicus TaxID=1306991 RepID=UPI00141F2251|nr:alpha/beta hydrolase [Pseudomaricurvus alkylphenolicus]NIB43475.1 alpha/beta hydrolase [Pseudomaricurvus alkylphenolicus]
MTIAQTLDNVQSETSFLKVDGATLEVKSIMGRNIDAPTLIFLHEGLGCTDLWHDFPEKLAAATGCSALLYSRKGYGRSAPCDVPRPLNYMHIEAIEVLPKLLKAVSFDEHILVGHSDGGSIALIYAGACAEPGLKGLITMAPHVFCEELTVNSIAQTNSAFEGGKLREGLAKYHHDNVDCAFWGWNKAWLDPEFRNWNLEEFLPGIQVPHLLLQGLEDQYGTVAQVESVQANSSGRVEVQMLEECGHSPYKEQEGQTLIAARRFINDILSL